MFVFLVCVFILCVFWCLFFLYVCGFFYICVCFWCVWFFICVWVFFLVCVWVFLVCVCFFTLFVTLSPVSRSLRRHRHWWWRVVCGKFCRNLGQCLAHLAFEQGGFFYRTIRAEEHVRPEFAWFSIWCKQSNS